MLSSSSFSGARPAMRNSSGKRSVVLERRSSGRALSFVPRAAKKADGPSVAIVGVTGAVGQEFLRVSLLCFSFSCAHKTKARFDVSRSRFVGDRCELVVPREEIVTREERSVGGGNRGLRIGGKRAKGEGKKRQTEKKKKRQRRGRRRLRFGC